MKAVKKVIFGVCRDLMGVKRVPLPLKGFRVDMVPVLELVIREQRLHRMDSPVLQLMLKIDGRPFWGNDFSSYNSYCFVSFLLFINLVCFLAI